MSDAPVKRKPFRRYFYRGYEVEKLLELGKSEMVQLFHARARRHMFRGRNSAHLMRRLRAAKKAAKGSDAPPETIKTHARNMIIMPEMVASVVGVYNGKHWTKVEIKPDMVGHYLGEFSITYHPVTHGRPSTSMNRFVPLH